MSIEKMILIRTLGLIVPQSAILSAAIMRKEERNHTLPQLSVEANPLVNSSRENAYYLYLAIDPKYIPNFEDDADEADEEKPKRGRKRAVNAAVEVAKPATFMLALHSDLLEDSVETVLSKSEALQAYIAEGEDNLERVRTNLGRLEKFVREINAAQDAMAPENTTSAAFADLVPSTLQNDIAASNNTAIELHGEQMRRAAEAARANYDKVINWFERKVLVSSSGSAETVNVTSDIPADSNSRSGEENTSLTVKKLIDLVKAELTVII